MNLLELNRALRQLRLGGIAAVLETRLQQAQTEAMAPIDLLSCLAPSALIEAADVCFMCPHIEIGGWHNNGEALGLRGHKILCAHKGNTWMVIAATVPFTECSCGYVGVNDGWTDLVDIYRLDWQYDAAYDGNIALTKEAIR